MFTAQLGTLNSVPGNIVPGYVPSTSPTVSPSTATVNQLATVQLTQSNFTGNAVTWSTSDAMVSTVSTSGLVTALAKAGTATITATGVSNPSQTATCTITVPAVAISVSPTTASLNVGGTQALTPTVTGTTNTAVTYSSSNTAYATVNSSGLVTAVAIGSANIVATSSADPTKTATCAVSVTSLATYLTSAAGLNPGLVGTVTVAISVNAGAYGTATTAGITEDTPGTYVAYPQAATGSLLKAKWTDGVTTLIDTNVVATPSSSSGSSPSAIASAVFSYMVEPTTNLTFGGIVQLIGASTTGYVAGLETGTAVFYAAGTLNSSTVSAPQIRLTMSNLGASGDRPVVIGTPTI